MRYEYNSDKSRANKAKHGLDFEAAQALWNDENRIEMDAQSETEPRFAVVGCMFGTVWTAFCTHRGQNIRIISVRRTRKEEIALYEREKSNAR